MRYGTVVVIAVASNRILYMYIRLKNGQLETRSSFIGTLQEECLVIGVKNDESQSEPAVRLLNCHTSDLHSTRCITQNALNMLEVASNATYVWNCLSLKSEKDPTSKRKTGMRISHSEIIG